LLAIEAPPDRSHGGRVGSEQARNPTEEIDGMKKLIVLAALVAISTALFAAAAAAGPAGGQGSIVDVARSSPNHKTLVRLVIAAGLVDELSDPSANLTVFAPTDAAFRNLQRDLPGVIDLLLLPENQDALQDILLYHVLGKEIMSKALRAAAKAEARPATLLGTEATARIELSLRGGKVRIDDSAGLYRATVTKKDLDASNGVVHVIDRVLVPQSIVRAPDPLERFSLR
jgi:uncharacterized surface protein with fasciclin (FAS1) repeats